MRIHSIARDHALEVECIAKGKAHKKYEFGVKVGLVTTSKESFVLGCKALHGNPYDGHTLQSCLDQAQSMTNAKIEEVYVDRGYKGHGLADLKVWIAGAKRGVTEKIKVKLKRRNAIEPVIGHMIETVDVQVTNGIRVATRLEVLDRTGAQTSPVIACGHSHIPRQYRTDLGQLIVKPGSVGLPAYSDVHPQRDIIENGSPHARCALLHQDANGWHAELVSVAYDYEPKVRLAQSNGRLDWAVALRTGLLK